MVSDSDSPLLGRDRMVRVLLYRTHATPLPIMRRNGDIGAAGGGSSAFSARGRQRVAICKALEQNDLLHGAEMQSCAASQEFTP